MRFHSMVLPVLLAAGLTFAGAGPASADAVDQQPPSSSVCSLLHLPPVLCSLLPSKPPQ